MKFLTETRNEIFGEVRSSALEAYLKEGSRWFFGLYTGSKRTYRSLYGG